MLSNLEAKFLLISRLAVGWLIFYAGITKIFDPTWSVSSHWDWSSNVFLLRRYPDARILFPRLRVPQSGAWIHR